MPDTVLAVRVQSTHYFKGYYAEYYMLWNNNIWQTFSSILATDLNAVKDSFYTIWMIIIIIWQNNTKYTLFHFNDKDWGLDSVI